MVLPINLPGIARYAHPLQIGGKIVDSWCGGKAEGDDWPTPDLHASHGEMHSTWDPGLKPALPSRHVGTMGGG